MDPRNFEERRRANIEQNRNLLMGVGLSASPASTRVVKPNQSPINEDPFVDTLGSKQHSSAMRQHLALPPRVDGPDVEAQATPSRVVRFEQTRLVEYLRSHSSKVLQDVVSIYERGLVDELDQLSTRVEEARAIIEQLQRVMNECNTLAQEAEAIHKECHQRIGKEMDQFKSAWQDLQDSGLARPQTVNDNIAEASRKLPQWTEPDSLETHPKWPTHWADLRKLEPVIGKVACVHVRTGEKEVPKTPSSRITRSTQRLDSLRARPNSSSRVPEELSSDDEPLSKKRRRRLSAHEEQFWSKQESIRGKK